jgi:hypothetical protein
MIHSENISWELSRPSGDIGWTGHAELSSETARQFWEKVWAVIVDQKETWDHIRVEMWLDSGRVIAFPALEGTDERIDNVTCQVVWANVLREWDQLSGLCEVDNDAFEIEAERLEHRVVQTFAGAVRAHPVKVIFYTADGKQLLSIDPA